MTIKIPTSTSPPKTMGYMMPWYLNSDGDRAVMSMLRRQSLLRLALQPRKL